MSESLSDQSGGSNMCSTMVLDKAVYPEGVGDVQEPQLVEEAG